MLGVLKRLKDYWDWAGLIWQLAGLFGLTGIIVTLVSTIWAAVRGLPAPFIMMGAFCTFVATVVFALVPLAYQAFIRQPKPLIADSNSASINYEAWRNRADISLGDAACLFADLAPTAENRARADVSQYLGALIDAARSGEMEFVFANPDSARIYSMADNERRYVGEHTRVTIPALKEFAKKRGYTPVFLR